MDHKRKNIRAYTRANLEVTLYTDLPKGSRKNLNKKKIALNPTWKPSGSLSVKSQYQPMVGRESSLLSSKLETTRLLGVIFSTSLQEEREYQDKNMSPMGDALHRLDVMAEMNHRMGYKNVMKDPFNPREVTYVETNLIDLDDLANSEETSTNKKQVY